MSVGTTAHVVTPNRGKRRLATLKQNKAGGEIEVRNHLKRSKLLGGGSQVVTPTKLVPLLAQ